MTARLLLVRHGQTDWNLEGRYQGRSDVPLNCAGRAQAEALAEALAEVRIDAVYSSTLSRARDTASGIAERHGLRVVVEPRLDEIDQGEWEGVLSTAIAERYGALFARWSEDPRLASPPGGESIRQVHDRVVEAVEEIAARHMGGTVCLVTHKTAIVVIRCHYLGLDLPQEMSHMPANAHWEPLEVQPGSVSGYPCCSTTRPPSHQP